MKTGRTLAGISALMISLSPLELSQAENKYPYDDESFVSKNRKPAIIAHLTRQYDHLKPYIACDNLDPFWRYSEFYKIFNENWQNPGRNFRFGDLAILP